MITPNPVMFALSAMILVIITSVVYFIIFFGIFYVMGWGIIQVLRPIFSILSYGRPH